VRICTTPFFERPMLATTSTLMPSWLQNCPRVSAPKPSVPVYQCVLVSSIPSKVYKHDNQTTLLMAIVDQYGVRLDAVQLAGLDFRLRLLKETDKLPVLEDILKSGESVVHADDCTIQIPFRITCVSKNYNNSNFIMMISQPHSLSMGSIIFEPLYTDAFRVLAKRPDVMTTDAKKDQRRNKRYKTPDWVEPWGICAYELLQKNEWSHCVGLYVGTDGAPLTGCPIRTCQECGGFQTQGHLFGCQYKKLLRNFNRTILITPKLQSSRRKRQRE
jgi:hypothetical protein